MNYLLKELSGLSLEPSWVCLDFLKRLGTKRRRPFFFLLGVFLLSMLVRVERAARLAWIACLSSRVIVKSNGVKNTFVH